MRAKTFIISLLNSADIKLDGTRPWDIQVHDNRFYRRVLNQRELGMGESYMDGWWDVKKLDEFIAKILAAKLQNEVRYGWAFAKLALVSILTNKQTSPKAKKNAEAHYNIGNDLYERMLDKRMVYSCAYWKGARNLDEAQEKKFELICRKLQLKRGMTLLDIGCGWGSFAEYAAKKYGVKVTAISPASEQVKIAKERVKDLDVRVLKRDYRDMRGKFDRIVSVGMLEHVGHKNYKEFFEICESLLRDDGLMLHHFIGKNRTAYSTDPWTDKYIFPGGLMPALSQVTKAMGKNLIVEDVQNLGPDYDKTLMAWHRNFVRRYPEIKDNYDERFFRMWSFWLLSAAGMFRARQLQLFQVVMRKPVISRTYRRPNL